MPTSSGRQTKVALGLLAVPALVSLASLSSLAGCARPIPLKQEWVVKQVSSRYHAFYPDRDDPDRDNDAGLLRPRFGLPAIARTGDAFDIEILQRGELGDARTVRAALLHPNVTDAAAAACLRGQTAPGCFPLALTPAPADPARAGEPPGAVRSLKARPLGLPPAGGYDLLITSPVDASTRVPRAVWLREDDPATLPTLKVAHLSDLHVGKGKNEVFTTRLRQVIADVNELRPDLVVITGDIVNKGQDPTLPPRAQGLLRDINAPILIIMGNHDIGFKRSGFAAIGYGGSGWSNFARSFHSYLHYSISMGRYDFVGFDSGPSQFSPRVLTRGIAPATLSDLHDELVSSRKSSHRGVVLFSHAPSRASLFGRFRPDSSGAFGRMASGSKAFEDMMLEAASQGQRVLHLAGHTHWSDVFEARPDARRQRRPRPFGNLHFARWPLADQSPCLRPIAGKAALITTQAASHSGLFFKDNARGYGFSFLILGDGDPEIAFHRFGTRDARRCEDRI